VSTTDIPILHSAEVAHLYPQVMLHICQGIATSHSSLPRKRGEVELRGVSKVPLVRENLLQIQEEGSIRIPHSKSPVRNALYSTATPPRLPLLGKVIYP
jgi:hypothetical protein